MKAELYVIVAANRNMYDLVSTIRAARMTRSKPKLGADEIAIRLVLDIPKEVFDTVPTAHVVVPPDAVVLPTIEAEAVAE